MTWRLHKLKKDYLSFAALAVSQQNDKKKSANCDAHSLNGIKSTPKYKN